MVRWAELGLTVLLAVAGTALDAGAQVFGPASPLNPDAASDPSWAWDTRPQLATDGAGNWVAVWQDGQDDDSHGIEVARSADDGVTWTDHAYLADADPDYTPNERNQYPQAATDGAGTWLVAWQFSEHDDFGDVPPDIVVVRSTDNGVTWTPRACLRCADGMHQKPQLATDGAGNWVAVWQRYDPTWEIQVARSADNGSTWETPVTLDADIYDYDPQVTTDGAGNWVLVWEACGYTTPFDVIVARSTDNGATWSTPAELDPTPGDGDDRHPQVTTDGAGNWLAVWQTTDSLGGTIGTDWDILAARSTDNGVTWSSPVTVNSHARTDSGDDTYPEVTTDGAGRWVTVWTSTDSLGGTIDTDTDILVATSTTNGNTWTSSIPLNHYAATETQQDIWPQLVTDAGGHWVAAWQSRFNTGGIGTDRDILMAHAPALPVPTLPPEGLALLATLLLATVGANHAIVRRRKMAVRNH